MLALPIFPVSHPTSIFGGIALNFCVRYGNRWTHDPISTNYVRCALKTERHGKDETKEAVNQSLHTYCRSSPRLISISQLKTLLFLHP